LATCYRAKFTEGKHEMITEAIRRVALDGSTIPRDRPRKRGDLYAWLFKSDEDFNTISNALGKIDSCADLRYVSGVDMNHYMSGRHKF